MCDIWLYCDSRILAKLWDTVKHVRASAPKLFVIYVADFDKEWLSSAVRLYFMLTFADPCCQVFVLGWVGPMCIDSLEIL